MVSLWSIIGMFAWLEYRNLKQYRVEALSNRVVFAVTNILTGHEEDLNMYEFMDFFESSIADSPVASLRMSIYDKRTGKWLYHMGRPARLDEKEVPEPHGAVVTTSSGLKLYHSHDVKLSDGTKAFLYVSGVSADGEIAVEAFLPDVASIDRDLRVGSTFWMIVIFVGIVGTAGAWVFATHQARNIKLLHDFANRAASDHEFVPMGDFPNDEIGDISRQIVAIYNARMQANVRRERDHSIALRAVEEKNTLKRMMTNNISHELKTPIGIIRSYLEMIQSNPDMSAEERSYFLGKAQANVERLVDMMSALSTITRLEESQSSIPISEIDFSDLVFQLAEDLSAGGVLKNMKFNVELPSDCKVYGNGELLIGILTNLTKNSVTYSQGTEITLKLIGRNQRFYTFSFSDNGTGVPEEHIPHLFERFYRIDKGRSRKVGGTGLGLSIVRNSLITMGGSVSVRNGKDGGLEFIFTLRRVIPGEDNHPHSVKPVAGEPEAVPPGLEPVNAAARAALAGENGDIAANSAVDAPAEPHDSGAPEETDNPDVADEDSQK